MMFSWAIKKFFWQNQRTNKTRMWVDRKSVWRGELTTKKIGRAWWQQLNSSFDKYRLYKIDCLAFRKNVLIASPRFGFYESFESNYHKSLRSRELVCFLSINLFYQTELASLIGSCLLRETRIISRKIIQLHLPG